ncbi:hypothetical protein OKW46_002727 [Paraburkholderia sp. WSM4179]|nr:hypothetical protein [Paraburkholderia sp. WSM4179]
MTGAGVARPDRDNPPPRYAKTQGAHENPCAPLLL